MSIKRLIVTAMVIAYCLPLMSCAEQARQGLALNLKGKREIQRPDPACIGASPKFTPPKAGRAPVIAGYYGVTDSLPVSTINFKGLTHIFHNFLLADKNGILKIEEGKMPSRELTTLAHKNNVRVILSLGGGAYKDFSYVTANEKRMNQYVESVMQIVDRYNYDGIDLDWESFKTRQDGEKWEKLVRSLRKELDKLSAKREKKFELTTALEEKGAKVVRTEVILENLDFLNIMAYNGFGRWGGKAGAHASLYKPEKHEGAAVSECIKFWHKEKKIPMNRLVFGMPFYTWACFGYKPGDTIDPKSTSREVKPLGWAQICELKKKGWTREMDKKAAVAWYFSPDRKNFAGVDEPEVITIKTKWAKNKKFRGVFYWHMKWGLMPDGSTPQQDAMVNAWQ
ncbi:glycoside hydrolase family 18 protein [Verrucomicrobiota bacterium]